jgi:hypothetical protein
MKHQLFYGEMCQSSELSDIGLVCELFTNLSYCSVHLFSHATDLKNSTLKTGFKNALATLQ